MKYIVGILIILTMFVIPYSIHGYGATLYIFIISCISLLCILYNQPGFEFILIAISLCIPEGFAHSSSSFPEISRISKAFNSVLFYLLPVVSIFIYIKHRKRFDRFLLLNVLSVILVGIISTIISVSFYEFYTIIIYLSTCFFFFVICRCDLSLDIKTVFVFIDVLFFITAFYGIQEFLFMDSPYQFIANGTEDLALAGRARGILGHPLYLSGVTLFYQANLFVRYIITKKFSYIQELVCVMVALIVVSRTTIVVMGVEYLLFLFVIKAYRSFKLVVANLILFSVAFFLIYHYVDELVIAIISRFLEDSTVSRESSYPAVMNLFFDNPFGVGYGNIMSSIYKGGYNGEGFVDDFTTVDNLFLTQIAAYGIFSLVLIFYFFYFFILSIKNKRRHKLLAKCILLLYTPYILQSFTFDWETSKCLCFLLFGLTGFLYNFNYSHYEKNSI